jgi:uncharacterized protein involved in exopolysaccharide biosynthesis
MGLLERLHAAALRFVEGALDASPRFVAMRAQIAADEKRIAEHMARMREKYPEEMAAAEAEMRRRYYHLHDPEELGGRGR